MRLKILLLHQNRFGRPWGGIETYCNQLKNLFIGDNEIEIITSPLYPHYTKFGKLKYDIIDIEAAIQNSDADIIQVNGYTSLAVRQAIKAGKNLNKKVILSPHWHPFNKMNSPILARLFWLFFIKPQLINVDGIICINNEDSKFFSKYHKYVKRIPHWIKEGTFIGNALYSKKENNILFVGRANDKNKGFKHLLSIPENKYSIHCVSEPINVNRSDIIFHPRLSREELTQLYKDSSLVVIPSRYEAFSYVALEAICAGCPVVMSDNVRLFDYINDSSHIGRFKYNNYRAFNRQIENFIHKRFSPELYIDKFNEESIKKEYKQFYREIAYDNR